MARGHFPFRSNRHGHFQQGFSLEHQDWASSTATLAGSTTYRSSPKSSLVLKRRKHRRTVALLLRMLSDLHTSHSQCRESLPRPVSIISDSPPQLPAPSVDTTAMRDPTAALRLRPQRSALSSGEERTWLSFSSLGSPAKLDRHAVMAAQHWAPTPTPTGAAGVIDSPRAALSAHQSWLVLQNVDRAFFRAHGAAVAAGTLKLGVMHEAASVKLLGCRVTLGRWHRAVWFEDECDHFKDPLAGAAKCDGAPCALELHEFVRVNPAAFDKVPRPIKAVWGYDKYVVKAPDTQ